MPCQGLEVVSGPYQDQEVFALLVCLFHLGLSRPSPRPLSPDGLLNVSPWLLLRLSFYDRFRAHDTRSVSFSWALFNGASLKDIQQAAFWSSPNTFISCYLKDVLAAEASFATSVLKTSVSIARGTSVSSSAPATSK